MKTIKFIVVFAMLIHVVSACGQNSKIKKCKIEFYLLKKEIVSVDLVTGLRSAFNATLNDLQDTVFIKDSEILSFQIQNCIFRRTWGQPLSCRQVSDSVDLSGLLIATLSN